jgi:hypothetical protein
MYIIPKNVKSKFEFFPGFGWKELFISLIFLLVGVGLFFLSGLFTRSMFRVIFIALTTATGILFVIEDPRSGSFLKFVQSYRKYKRKPRRYEYRFKRG